MNNLQENVAGATGKAGGFFGGLMVNVMRGVKGFVSDMAAFKEYTELLDHALPGDLIEIQGKGYNHYAVYLGDGIVMTVDAEDNALSEARVSERTLEQACNGAKVRVRNHDTLAASEFQATPRSPEEIIKAAKYYEGKLVPYEQDVRNCEYYCTFWRYGTGFSTQAKNDSSTNVLGSILGEVTNATKYVGSFNPLAKGPENAGYEKYEQFDNQASNVVHDETGVTSADSIL